MEQLFLSLNAIKLLSSGLESWLRQRLKMRKLKKGDFLLREGEICKNIYFLESGIIRIFHIVEGKNGNIIEKTTWLQCAGEYVIAINSFFNQIASLEHIQALEDCVVWYISFDELKKACELYPEFECHASHIKSTYHSFNDEKMIMLTKGYKERYIFFLKEQPWLSGKVNVRHLVSYMNMSRSTYFNVRKDIARGK